MINKQLFVHVAVISHKRPENVMKIQDILCSMATFYVNKGEGDTYRKAGALGVVECGDNICDARNAAIEDAHDAPSIQISDDLKKIKRIYSEERKQVDATFAEVVQVMVKKLREKYMYFGGVAVTNNPLNYNGEDFSYDKLVVCDLICMMPSKFRFDIPLKEDYDMTLQQLTQVGGLVRLNNYLCDFPHRTNAGGANTYREGAAEAMATQQLIKKWPGFLKPHATRAGQISLNYKAIKQSTLGQGKLF